MSLSLIARADMPTSVRWQEGGGGGGGGVWKFSPASAATDSGQTSSTQEELSKHQRDGHLPEDRAANHAQLSLRGRHARPGSAQILAIVHVVMMTKMTIHRWALVTSGLLHLDAFHLHAFDNEALQPESACDGESETEPAERLGECSARHMVMSSRFDLQKCPCSM